MSLDACLRVSAASIAATGNRSPSLAPGHREKFHLFPGRRSTAGATPAITCPLLPGRTARRQPRFLCQAQNAVNEVVVVTDKNWESVVAGGETPVLVDFWAEWCGPCRMIAPIIDELAKEYAGKIVCCKCNTDDCPAIATKYGIRSIPTVLVFKNGEKKETVIGAVPKSTLTTIVDKYLDL